MYAINTTPACAGILFSQAHFKQLPYTLAGTLDNSSLDKQKEVCVQSIA